MIYLGMCPTISCDANFERFSSAQVTGKEIYTEGSSDEGVVPASTSVFVLEPGEMPSKFGWIWNILSNLWSNNNCFILLLRMLY